jgi:hypothetical protein
MDKAKELLKEFQQLKNDGERWGWLIKHKDNPHYVLKLDNDDTFLEFKEVDGWGQFDDYLGWGEGVQNLLEAIGINAELV